MLTEYMILKTLWEKGKEAMKYWDALNMAQRPECNPSYLILLQLEYFICITITATSHTQHGIDII